MAGGAGWCGAAGHAVNPGTCGRQYGTLGGCQVAIRRAELADGETSMTAANDLAVRRALVIAGVEFIDENGGGPGVRLRKLPQGKQRK